MATEPLGNLPHRVRGSGSGSSRGDAVSSAVVLPAVQAQEEPVRLALGIVRVLELLDEGLESIREGVARLGSQTDAQPRGGHDVLRRGLRDLGAERIHEGHRDRPALAHVERQPSAQGGSEPRLSRETNAVHDRADQYRKDLKDDYLSVEHLLLAMNDRLGVTSEELLGVLREVRGSHRVTDQNPEEKFAALEKYGQDLTARAAEGKPREPAQSIIVLWMQGGPSQLETFDPHPGTDIAAGTGAISTAVKGIQLAPGLARTAEEMGSIALVRSMVSKEGDHERGTYTMKTGYRPDPTVVHPAIGAICRRSPRSAAMSSASRPSRDSVSGLISSPRSSGISTIICDSATSTPQSAWRSPSGCALPSSSMRSMLVPRIRSRASARLMGGNPMRRSSSVVTLRPPAPKSSSGPNTASRVKPTLSCADPRPRRIGCAAKPSTRLSG